MACFDPVGGEQGTHIAHNCGTLLSTPLGPILNASLPHYQLFVFLALAWYNLYGESGVRKLISRVNYQTSCSLACLLHACICVRLIVYTHVFVCGCICVRLCVRVRACRLLAKQENNVDFQHNYQADPSIGPREEDYNDDEFVSHEFDMELGPVFYRLENDRNAYLNEVKRHRRFSSAITLDQQAAGVDPENEASFMARLCGTITCAWLLCNREDMLNTLSSLSY